MKNDADSPQVVALPPAIFLGGIIGGFILDLFIPQPFFPEVYDLPAGLALMSLAFALMAWAVYTFESAGTNVDVRKPTTSVVTKGPYAFSRNPIYIAMTIFSLGAAVWLNSLWIFLGTALAHVVLHFGVIVKEEAYLEKKFGAAYKDYTAKVRRWV